MSILDTIVPIVGTVANAVAKGANFYKELRGGGIKPDALAEVLKVEDTKPAVASTTDKESAFPSKAVDETKTGKRFFFISPK